MGETRLINRIVTVLSQSSTSSPRMWFSSLVRDAERIQKRIDKQLKKNKKTILFFSDSFLAFLLSGLPNFLN